MNNEVEMVKIMKTLTTTCKIFILKNEQEILLNLLMYLLGLKMLKMVTNKRQNFYKFKKWEVFRECDEYKINVSQIFNFITKIET